jgi:hypothetical protein
MTDQRHEPACNRVTPFGDIEAFPLRGAFTGNRGILHSGQQIVRFHAHDSWLTCSTTFKDRWNEQWLPHRFTWLYFYDEAVALAAGHRPCAECRRPSYNQYRMAWAHAAGGEVPSAKEMDRQLHRERIVRGTHRRQLHQGVWRDLPEGTFVDLDGSPWLVLSAQLAEWSREGYQGRRPRPTTGLVTVITPPSSVAVLRAGYPVQIHPSALVPPAATQNNPC